MMDYSFKSPEMLLLLLFVPFFIVIAMRSKADITLSKKIIITFLRVAAFVALVFSVSGFSRSFNTDELYVVYLIDNSDSYSEQNMRAALNHIYKASEYMKKDDKAAVIVFGKEAVVELPFSQRISYFNISSYVDRSHTNIAQAIKIAELLFPEDVQKRIVLFSDGNENEGNALEEAKIAASHGIEVITVIPDEDETADFSIEKLIIPKSVSINEPFEVRIVMTGNADGKAVLSVSLDKDEIYTKEVYINKGKKKVVILQESLKKKGAHIFDVSLTSADDIHTENNSSQGFVLVSGTQTVLYVYDGDKRSDDLIKVLEANRLKVDVTTPERLNPSISYLSNYDTVIFDNVPATRLSTHHMKSIQTYVKAFGGGFIMIGGGSSFGLGGYYKTPIEKMLPVEMDIKQRKKYASVAMVVIIDKSGSMSYTEGGRQKIELANEGAINVLDLLFVNDMIGVIACDSVPKWAVDLQKIDDKEAVIDYIASIRAGGGGIYIYSSLEEAYEKLKDIKANLKHVILFSDAADAEEQVGANGEHVYALAKRMAKDRITVSTIAIGKAQDKDLKFLKETAFYGKGRFYFTSDMFTLPQIFAKEAFIASKSLVLEEDFIPVKKDALPELSNVDLSAMPPLKGYVITSEKKMAVVPYETPYADPLLAVWQYGLGRSCAFSSDAKAKWAVNWIGSDGYNEFWSQLVRWTLKKEESSNYEVNLTKKENKINISVDALDERGEFLNFADLQATFVTPDFQVKKLTLKQTGSGRYEAEGDIDKSGTYFVNISRVEDGEITDRVNAGISLSYLDEYKRFSVNTKFLTHLAEVTGGRIFTGGRDLFESARVPAVTFRTIVEPLILIGIILFVLDAMLRKVAVSRTNIISIKERIPKKSREEEHGYEWLKGKREGEEEAEEPYESERPEILYSELPVEMDETSGKEKVVIEPEAPEKGKEETTLGRLIKVKKSTFDKNDKNDD